MLNSNARCSKQIGAHSEGCKLENESYLSLLQTLKPTVMILKHQKPKSLSGSRKDTRLRQLNRTKPPRSLGPVCVLSLEQGWTLPPIPSDFLRHTSPNTQDKTNKTSWVTAISERIASPHQMSCLAWPYKCSPSSVSPFTPSPSFPFSSILFPLPSPPAGVCVLPTAAV